jgi:hypothetical protein
MVRKLFGEIGNAGGHRAMAKAVVPMAAFAERYGQLTPAEINRTIRELALHFLHDHSAADRRK